MTTSMNCNSWEYQIRMVIAYKYITTALQVCTVNTHHSKPQTWYSAEIITILAKVSFLFIMSQQNVRPGIAPDRHNNTYRRQMCIIDQNEVHPTEIGDFHSLINWALLHRISRRAQGGDGDDKRMTHYEGCEPHSRRICALFVLNNERSALNVQQQVREGISSDYNRCTVQNMRMR